MAIHNLTTTQAASPTSVQTVITAASAGDTIVFPAGTYTWSSSITVSKSLTLTGIAGGGSGTVKIKNNITTGPMISATSGSDGHIVIANIYFDQIVDNSGGAGYCLVLDRDDSTVYTVIVRDCTLDTDQQFTYMVYGSANGLVFWNDTFQSGLTRDGLAGATLVCTKYGATSENIGPGGAALGWNTADTMGVADTTGLNNTYFDNCFFKDGPSSNMNADDNSRVVVRYSTIQDGGLLAHGQDTSQYGMRHFEIYNNTFHNVDASGINVNAWIYIRGAVYIIANNSIDVITGKTSIVMTCQQCQDDAQVACQTSYPANRQIGYGWSSGSSTGYGNPVVTSDGTGQTQDPCYIWGNTGTGASVIGFDDVTDVCGNGLTASDFIHLNRDYFVGTARPGWKPFQYPHPLILKPSLLPLSLSVS